MHVAARVGEYLKERSIAILQYLLDHGADATQLTHKGKTVEDVATGPAKAFLAKRRLSGPMLTDAESREQLDQLYTSFQGPVTKHDLPAACRGEEHCPVTYLPLKWLQHRKRLVHLEGNCYAFMRSPTTSP